MEAVMTRTVKVIENALAAVTRIILLENVQNHQKTRTKEHLSEVKDHDIKFYCSNGIKSKIKILYHKHAEGTAKNSQDNKVRRLKTLEGSGDESFWEEGDDFRVDVLHFHTCLTVILGFLEKLKCWFEQDIDDEGEEDEDGEGGSEV
nr:hypothetical protein [Tanacetum cinerariifolium]